MDCKWTQRVDRVVLFFRECVSTVARVELPRRAAIARVAYQVIPILEVVHFRHLALVSRT